MSWNIYLAPTVMANKSGVDTLFPSFVDDLDGTAHEARWQFSFARDCVICFVECPDAAHTLIQVRAGVVRILPLLGASFAQIKENYNTPLTDVFTGAQLVAVRNAIEAKGFDMEWTDASTTLKQVLRFLLKCHIMGEWAEFAGNTNLKAFLAANLDATVGSLTAAQRNAASTWMTNHGLAIAWITGSTTVRAVMRYIMQNYDGGFPQYITGVEDI